LFGGLRRRHRTGRSSEKAEGASRCGGKEKAYGFLARGWMLALGKTPWV